MRSLTEFRIIPRTRVRSSLMRSLVRISGSNNARTTRAKETSVTAATISSNRSVRAGSSGEDVGGA